MEEGETANPKSLRGPLCPGHEKRKNSGPTTVDIGRRGSRVPLVDGSGRGTYRKSRKGYRAKGKKADETRPIMD